ncbi:MAG: mannose-1-phosphate guanylyltransferase, partial [Acetobacter sp.]|nr:mannose-1-phosphate guanylyltransferase [Acetobacter sp.]
MSYENFSLIPVILSGGSGSRLWPVSRKSFPKQFWPLLSTKTLLQETILRGIAGGTTRPIIVCNVDHRFIIAEQLRAVGEDRACILLEPEGRNSAPAISAAAFLIAEENPEAVMWIMAADAAIQDEKALLKDLKVAVQTAMAGYIVTFGIKPTRPETGYGYIQCGVPLGGTDAVYCVDQFLEKPDINQAMELVQNERNLWNSGMFVVKARVLLEEIARFEPKVYACVKEAVA